MHILVRGTAFATHGTYEGLRRENDLVWGYCLWALSSRSTIKNRGNMLHNAKQNLFLLCIPRRITTSLVPHAPSLWVTMDYNLLRHRGIYSLGISLCHVQLHHHYPSSLAMALNIEDPATTQPFFVASSSH